MLAQPSCPHVNMSGATATDSAADAVAINIPGANSTPSETSGTISSEERKALAEWEKMGMPTRDFLVYLGRCTALGGRGESECGYSRLLFASLHLLSQGRPSLLSPSARSAGLEGTYAGDNESVLRDHERSRILRVGLRGARGAIKCWGTIAGWES